MTSDCLSQDNPNGITHLRLQGFRLDHDRAMNLGAALQSDEYLSSQIAASVELIAPQNSCLPPSARA